MATVLVSVSDKTGLEEFAKGLASAGSFEFVATTSTAKFLSEKQIPCGKVEDLTGFPEILGGRVKTLHPHVFAGILSRDTDADRACLKDLSLPEIDILICNLYPFEKRLAEGLPESKMIEEIDIGGVTLLRAAAKNFDRVMIVCDPAQYESVLAHLQENRGKSTKDFRRKLALAAFERTRSYDTAISAYLAGNVAAAEPEAPKSKLPESLNLNLKQYQSLRYGENPHQSAIWYAAPGEGNGRGSDFPPFEQLQGKEMSSNNLVDTFALTTFLKELEDPGVCIIKHNNPCGIAQGKTLMEAFDKALSTDPISAFGGIFGFTGEVTGEIVDEMTKGFVEIVAAPAFTAEALDKLLKKKNVRVLQYRPDVLSRYTAQSWKLRDLQDFGWIIERADEPPVKASAFELAAGKRIESLDKDVAFAWNVVKHLTSNAIFIARDGKSLGFGIGQTSRIASVKIALAQAGEAARGAVLASDAFFPATDNIEAAAAAGISVIVQPGGSIKDKEVVEAAASHGITMLLTGQRCFKH